MKEMLLKIMENEDVRKALKELIISNQDLANELGVGAQQNVYVWCAELINLGDGECYYHPIVVPKNEAMRNPTLEMLLDMDTYKMLGYEDQFAAYDNEHIARRLEAMMPVSVKLLTIPRNTYNELNEGLYNLVGAILKECEACFNHFEAIARMTNTNADRMKANFIMSVFAQTSTVSMCLTKELMIENSDNHEYNLEMDEDDNDIFDEPYCFDGELDDEDD